jgi:hypothetical protein
MTNACDGSSGFTARDVMIDSTRSSGDTCRTQATVGFNGTGGFLPDISESNGGTGDRKEMS